MRIFDYTEVVSAANKDPDCIGLYIDESSANQLVIARLMIGSVQIDHMTRSVQIIPTIDYLSDFYQSSETDPIKRILEYCGGTLAPWAQTKLSF